MLTNDVTANGRRKLGRASAVHSERLLDTCFLAHDSRLSQSSLHFNMQTTVRASDAKSFAMKTLGEQVQAFMNAHDWRSADMAKAVKAAGAKAVERQHIEGVLAGIERPRYLPELAAAMGTTVETLTAGAFIAGPKPAMAAQMTAWVSPSPAHAVNEPQIEYAGLALASRRIPVVGTARMGDDGFYDEISSMAGAGDGYLHASSNDPNAYGLRVRGSSMFPALRDGWYVVIEPNAQPREGEYVLIKLRDGRRMVKEFLYRRADSVEVSSVNGGTRLTIDVADLDEHRGIQPVKAIQFPSNWQPD
jgi:SOS-response transcriptional repressor LexA